MLHYHHYHHYLHLHLHHFYHQNPTSLAEAQSEAQFVTLWNCPSTRLRTHSISQKHPKWLQIIVSVHLANSSSLHFSFVWFFFSLLPYICWGRSDSLKDTCFSQRSISRAYQSYIRAAPSHRKSCKIQHCESGKYQRSYKHKSLPLTVRPISHERLWKGFYSKSFWSGIHAAGTPGHRCKNARLRTKQNGVRRGGWTRESCRVWYNDYRDPIL